MGYGVAQLLGIILYEVFLASAFGAFMPMKKRKTSYLVYALLPLMAMSMLHSANVGSDTKPYIEVFNQYRSYDLNQLIANLRFEHGYLILNWIIGRFTDNPQWIFIIVGMLLYASMFRWMRKYLESPGLYVILIIEILVFDYWISALRQSIVAAILFVAFDALVDKKLFRFSVLVLIASTFHKVAFAFLFAYPLVNLTHSKNRHTKGGQGFEGFLAVVTIIALVFLEPLLQYAIEMFPIYAYYSNGAYMDGKVRVATMLNTIIYTMMVFFPRLMESRNVCALNKVASVKSLYCLGLICIALTVLANEATIITRVASLFSPFLIAYYGTIVSNFASQKNRRHTTALTIVAFLAYAVVITVTKTPEWQQTYPFTWCWQYI